MGLPAYQFSPEKVSHGRNPGQAVGRSPDWHYAKLTGLTEVRTW
jgi:hypothetical protein